MARPLLIAACLILAWAASGITRVPLGHRAIALRLGAPTAILRAGLHATLPWPFGAARPLDNGAIHAVTLAQPVLAADAQGNVEPITETAQILWRAGPQDQDALHFATLAAPDALLRALAGRILTEDAATGAPQALTDAASLRRRLQAALIRLKTGLDIAALTVTAPTTPTESREAARAAIATAHAAAAATTAQSRQAAYALTAAAHADAAEIIARSHTAALRFTADRDAARLGGQSFLLERYLAALTTSVAKAPKIIIDHRLNYPEAPVLDLRPLSAAAASAGKED